jgi:hypothetical protein
MISASGIGQNHTFWKGESMPETNGQEMVTQAEPEKLTTLT